MNIQRHFGRAGGEQGAALILALLVLMVLAVFSMTAIITASTGLKISSKYKMREQALYTADGAADGASGIISRAISNGNRIDATDLSSSYFSVSTTDTDGDGVTDLEAEIAGINGTKTSRNPDGLSSPNATVDILGDTASIDIDYLQSKLMPGASSEFAARYEGIGSGTSGGVAVTYEIDSSGEMQDQSAKLGAVYKCVEGGGRCL